MATYLGTAAVFQVMSGATAGNLGGGGFNPANANFITNFTATSATSNSPIISSASYNFVAGDVGSWIYVKSGTNWTSGWYQIASVGANAATVNAAIGQAVQVINNRFVTNTVAGCATTASPTAGTCGIDYSQQISAQVTNNVLTGTTTTCTDATTPFGAQHVGNFLCISAGTGVTAGWYEIVSVSGVTATLDRTAGTSYSGCTYYLGGAVSLGGSTAGITDAIFFALGGSSATTGCRFFIQGNATYAVASAITNLLGTASWPSITEGYNSIRGDRPSIASGNQPILNMSATAFTTNSYTELRNLTFIGTTAGNGLLQLGLESQLIGCKVKNTSSTAGQSAINNIGGQGFAVGCEAISYNGVAIAGEGSTFAIGCYVHDSSTGIALASGNNYCINNIVVSCTTQAINETAPGNLIYGNTLYGTEAKFGIGINTPWSQGVKLNNIIYGFVSGYGGTSTRYNGYADYTCFFNNTTNIAGTASGTFFGANDVTTTNPSFTSVSQVTGTTATSATNVLTDSGQNFTTAGVVAGRDYLHVTSASGTTVAVYGITAVGTTTITTDNTLGTGTAVNYFITINRNMLPTGAV